MLPIKKVLLSSIISQESPNGNICNMEVSDQNAEQFGCFKFVEEYHIYNRMRFIGDNSSFVKNY